MGLSSLLLVERQRQEKAEQDKAALREIERRPRLPEGFDRDEARRAIIADVGRHTGGMPAQLFIAMQNGLPSLSDGAMYELFCDLGLDRKEEPEARREPPPAPEPKPEPEPEPPPVAEASAEPVGEPVGEPLPAEPPPPEPAEDTKQKGGRRGR